MDEGSFWGQLSSGEGEGFRVDPDKVRNVELRHEPLGREGVRVTVTAARGRIKVFTAPNALLASVIEKLYDADREAGFRG